MQSPFIKNKEGAGKEKIRLNRKVATFLACLALSVLFWLMMALSKDYTIVLSYPVEYVNAPKDKVISNLLPRSIDMEIKARGFYLLAHKFKDPQTVFVDLSDNKALSTKNYYYILTNEKMNKIAEQFSSRINIVRIIPDSIFLNFNKKITKRVPVVANIKMSFNNQFQLSDSVLLEPAFVEVSGAVEVLAKLNKVETSPIVLKDIEQSKMVELDLLRNTPLGEVDINVKKVKALINVKKYTEAVIELPIEPINLPSGYSLKAFPDKVTVKYNVAFDNYGKMNSSLFRAVIDYKKAEPNSNKLKIVLEKFPTEIRSVKLDPEKVEYILKK